MVILMPLDQSPREGVGYEVAELMILLVSTGLLMILCWWICRCVGGISLGIGGMVYP